MCESRQQVEWIARRRVVLERIGQFVAATPDAAWALEKRGFAFIRLEDFDERRSSADVEELVHGQIEWARWVDGFLQADIPEFKRLSFSPARTYLLSLKSAWDTCIHRAAVLQVLATRARPAEIVFFANRHPSSFDDGLAMQGSVLAASIPAWAAHYGITATALPPVRDRMWELEYTHIGLGFRHTLSRALERVRRHYQLLRKIAASAGQPASTQGSGASRPIVIVKREFDVTGEMVERLRGLGMDTVEFHDVATNARRRSPSGADPRPALADAWNRIVARAEFWRPQGWQDWSLRPLLEPVFRHFWFAVIPALWRSTTTSVAELERHRPHAMVLGVLSGTEESGLLMAARALDIPIALYRHGVAAGDLEVLTIDVTDRYWGDFILTYGTGQSTFIRSRPAHADGEAAPIAVGSARIDQVRRRGRSRKAESLRARLAGSSELPVVVYVPGVFFSNYYRFESHDFRNIRCFEMRRGIAALFNLHQDVRFVYKSFLSQGHDPTLEMLAETCPNCVVIGNVPLTDLQWAADALIHEIPSSGMVESMVTDKPLIVLADREVYRMSVEAKALLRRRLTLAETAPEFVGNIQSLLVEGGYSPVSSPDQEFLRTFVTDLNDGASAARAADAIYKVATGTANSH